MPFSEFNKGLLSFLDNLPDPIVVADLDRKIVKVNPAFTTLFGYAEDAVKGHQTLMIYASEDDFYKTGKHRFNINAERDEEAYVIEYRRSNGETFMGETTGVALLNEQQEKVGYIGIIRDITNRRRFDDSIFKFQMITASSDLTLNEKIDRILEITTEYYDLDIGILSHIEDNTYTVQNCFTKDMSLEAGQTFDLGETYCLKTLNSPDVVALHDVMQTELLTHPCYIKFQLNAYIGIAIKVAGKKYGTLSFSSPHKRNKRFTQRDKDILKVAAGWISFALTKSGYEDTLITEREKAKAENEAKTSFIANVSHEVRTPLNGIMGYADILENMIDDPDVRRLSEKIHTSATNLLYILNDLIDISKIGQGQFKILDSVYQPDQLIQETADLYAPNADKNKNTIIIRIDPSMPRHVSGDPTRLRQILNNIVSNAVKFTHNGHIKISAFYDKKNQHIRFQITDTGIGIPPDMQSEVFNEYIQADNSITKKYGGTGLGLSISKKLIEMMDGTIKLDSNLGLGTTITLSIPAKTAEPSNQKTTNSDGLLKGKLKRNPRILLVEDIPMNVEIASAMLYRASCDIDVATNGEEALKTVQEKDFDLILMDIQMPDIDGTEVAQEVRKLGIETPIIAMTAHTMSHEIKAFMDAGMNDYLPKPLIFNTLEKTVYKWVN